MTSRVVSQQRKRALAVDLLSAINRGTLQPGARVPSLASLALRYGLSKPVVLDTLRGMVADGSLAKGAVGYVVGDGRGSAGTCVILHDTVHSYHNALAVDVFTRQLARRGISVVLRRTEAFLAEPAADRASVAGVFGFKVADIGPVLDAVGDVPVIQYLEGAAPSDIRDPRLRLVDVDNAGGGQVATRQLLLDGIDSVAFLGIHSTDATNVRPWSRQRASGWREALRQRHPRSRTLELTVHHSDTKVARAELSVLAADAHQEFAACVGADDLVIMAMADELRARRIPVSRWPLMVGFEGLSLAKPYVFASVRPDWEGLGSRAAAILLNATRGRCTRDSPVTLSSMAVVARG